MTLKAHDKSVKDLCFMDDDKIISCSKDQKIRIWDKYSYQFIRKGEQNNLNVS